jgi:hypothetical protein
MLFFSVTQGLGGSLSDELKLAPNGVMLDMFSKS